LLQLVAKRLREKLRESDILCRQGGDEFVLLIPQAPELSQLVTLAQTLRDAVGQPYPDLPDSIAVSLSIGIARWPDHALDADGLLNAADTAMYRAKQGGDGFIDVAPALPVPSA
jgi:diguanylate cyclase (GGDEF)-like protein